MTGGMHILVVEDDAALRDYLQRGLQEAGHTVDLAADGLEALHQLTEYAFDGVVMDRTMPKLDGLAVLKAIREQGNRVPVLLLSALVQVDERVKGLQAGADDYLVKPFALSELLARLEVLARRGTQVEDSRPTLNCGGLTLDVLKRVAARDGKSIPLQNQEFRLLDYLMRHQGQVVTRTMLLEQVWGYHFDPGTNLVDAHIARLRRKIDDGFASPLLQTVRGVGYKIGH